LRIKDRKERKSKLRELFNLWANKFCEEYIEKELEKHWVSN
jgi:hypothetical protein